MTATAATRRRRTEQIRIGHPPFAYRVEAPDDWAQLETAPNRWERSVQRILDDQADAARLPSAVRRGAASILADVVALAQQTGVVLCLAKLATDRNGQAFCGTLSLAWYDSAPVAADLPFARLVAGGDARQGLELDTFETPIGPALLRREPTTVPAEWGQLFPGRHAHTAQAFVPIPDTSWTALVSGTVGHPDHAELLGRLVRRMAATIEPQRPTEAPTDTAGEPPAAEPPAPPAPTARMGRGFRTTRTTTSTTTGNTTSPTGPLSSR